MTARLDSKTLFDIVTRHAAEGAPFIDWATGSHSFKALQSDIRKCCGLFSAAGLDPGARILIQTGNERIAVAVFTAALLDGLVPVMLTPETPTARRRGIAELTEPGLVVLDRALCADDPAISSHPYVLRCSGVHDSFEMLERLRGDQAIPIATTVTASMQRPPRCTAAPDDLAYILFTSGTTSAPKGVMVTHRNLFAHLETLSRVFAYHHDSAIFNGMVLAHGDGLVQGPLLALANGCRLIRPPAFSPHGLETYLTLVREKRATHFITVPTIYGFIDRYARLDDYFAGDEFIALLSVAAKLEEPLWRRLEKRFGRPVYNQYGLTETVASALYAGPGPHLGPIGTIGKPIDVAVRLMRDGRTAAGNEAGEIWLSGENVSPGYFADPAATAEKYEGPWLKTGDLAIRRPDGAYEVVGRIKTIIMSGGFLINPEEVDEALLSHPAVVEAVTLGLPDADFGEIPVSAVVLDTVADEFELTAHCSRLLEPKKVPKRIAILPSIPRGDAGKPQLTALRSIVTVHLRGAPAPSVRASEALVIEAASQVFRIPASALSLDSSPDSVPAWDSFAHVALILEVQRRSNRDIPPGIAVTIDSLRKLADTLQQPAPPAAEPVADGPSPFGIFVGSSMVTYAFPKQLAADELFPALEADNRIVRISSDNKLAAEIVQEVRRAAEAGVKRIFADIGPLLLSYWSRLDTDNPDDPDLIEYPVRERRFGQPGCAVDPGDNETLHHCVTVLYPVRVHGPQQPDLVRQALEAAARCGAEVVWVCLPRSQFAATYLGPEFEKAFAARLQAFADNFGATIWRPAAFWPDDCFGDTAHMNPAGQARFLQEMRCHCARLRTERM